MEIGGEKGKVCCREKNLFIFEEPNMFLFEYFNLIEVHIIHIVF